MTQKDMIEAIKKAKPEERYKFAGDELLYENCPECFFMLAMDENNRVRMELAKRFYVYKDRMRFLTIATDPNPGVRRIMFEEIMKFKPHFMELFVENPPLAVMYSLGRDKALVKKFWLSWYSYLRHRVGYFIETPEEEKTRGKMGLAKWLHLYEEEPEEYENMLATAKKAVLIQLLSRPDVGLVLRKLSKDEMNFYERANGFGAYLDRLQLSMHPYFAYYSPFSKAVFYINEINRAVKKVWKKCGRYNSEVGYFLVPKRSSKDVLKNPMVIWEMLQLNFVGIHKILFDLNAIKGKWTKNDFVRRVMKKEIFEDREVIESIFTLLLSRASLVEFFDGKYSAVNLHLGLNSFVREGSFDIDIS